jgi:hypothetical protein
MPIERRAWNVAVDVNRQVYYVVRDCGIVHGEREIVPTSPQSIRPVVVDDGSRSD